MRPGPHKDDWCPYELLEWTRAELSAEDIAKHWGCSPSTVRRRRQSARYQVARAEVMRRVAESNALDLGADLQLALDTFREIARYAEEPHARVAAARELKAHVDKLLEALESAAPVEDSTDRHVDIRNTLRTRMDTLKLSSDVATN